jgi:hypothetical protein
VQRKTIAAILAPDRRGVIPDDFLDHGQWLSLSDGDVEAKLRPQVDFGSFFSFEIGHGRRFDGGPHGSVTMSGEQGAEGKDPDWRPAKERSRAEDDLAFRRSPAHSPSVRGGFGSSSPSGVFSPALKARFLVDASAIR